MSIGVYEAMHAAITNGHLRTVQLMRPRITGGTQSYLALAANLGRTNIMFTINDWNLQYALQEAIENGQVATAHQLLKRLPMPDYIGAMRVSQHPQMVDYLLRHRQYNPDHMLEGLAENDTDRQISIDRIKSVALCIAYGGTECNGRSLGPDVNDGSRYDWLTLQVLQFLEPWPS